jgi:hypothetical protein
MGKRELLLIVGFVLTGTLVYYATAPAQAPGQEGFSVAKILDAVRREVRGNHASAEVRTTNVLPIAKTTAELRFEATESAQFVITGEAREDIAYELTVRSTGPDEAQARQYAEETRLFFSEAGGTLLARFKYPEPAEQRATVTMRVPQRLRVRFQPSRGTLQISKVASVELVEARGQVAARHIAGRVVATHRGGTLTIEDVGSLKLNCRGSTVRVKDIGAEAYLQLQAGDVRASGLGGPVEIDSNSARIALDGGASTRGPTRVNAVGGSVTLSGVRTEARIDGRDTRIEATIDKPAPISIYNDADEPTLVTLPAGGFQLDALASDSRITAPDALPPVKTTDREQRLTAVVGGGGPTITIRSSRGTITIKPAAGQTQTSAR